MLTRRERRALMSFAKQRRSDKRGQWVVDYRDYWLGVELLPQPRYMPQLLIDWAAIAESLAMEGTAVRR